MYNDAMPDNSYEIRKCNSCGLRYPLMVGHPVGTRCPICMGETSIVHRVSRELITGTERLPGRVYALEPRTQRAVILDNIRSAWNVGSILRSADGFGFSHAYLCGITPTPEHEAVTKTSLGAEASVPWSYHKDAVKVVRDLKEENWKVYGLEQDARAIVLNGAISLAPRKAIGASIQREVLIVGNEVTGVDPELLDRCDKLLYIPMRGEKKSFNVAVAFGIAAYALSVKSKERLS